MTKRALVTGASGFIGRWVTPFLMKMGYEVHLSDIRPISNVNRERNGIRFHQCNLLNNFEANKLIETVKPSHLLHFAWDVTHGAFWNAKSNLQWVSTTISLIESFCEAGGKRIVVAGTCAEYDWNYGYCKEYITPTNPATLYGICKDSLFSIMSSFSETQGLSTAWGRIFNLYGPEENAARFIPYVIQRMLKNKTVKCGYPDQIRDYMYVCDVAKAFAELLNSNVEGAVNIATGNPTKLDSIVNLIASLTDFNGDLLFGTISKRENDPGFLVADTKRLCDELKFQGSFSMEDGLTACIKYWKNVPK